MFKRLKLLFSFLLVCSAGSAFAALANGTNGGAQVVEKAATETEESRVIQVKAIVEVDGVQPEITLGDLVVVHGVSTGVLDSIKNVRLADTPKPGESRSFTAAGLEQVFHQHLRNYEEKSGEKITLRIPTRVTVVRKSFRLKPEEVITDLRNQFKSFCEDCVFDISGLTLPSVPTTVSSGSTWAIRLRHEMPKGNFSVPLEVSNDDGSKRTYWISGSVAVNRRVPVMARSVQSGEHLRGEDFTMQLKDVTFSNDIAASESEISASVAARQIGAGQIIWKSSLRRELAVKNGDSVKVIAGSDEWQITVEGIAQNSAYIGDSVNVKIPRTQKLISGLLTSRGVVEVR